MKKFLPPLIPFVVITIALEWMVRSGAVPAYLVPAPSSVLAALIDSRDELAAAMAKTSAAALIGCCLPRGRSSGHFIPTPFSFRPCPLSPSLLC
jgi:NitT/TauT family transport system permease protein